MDEKSGDSHQKSPSHSLNDDNKNAKDRQELPPHIQDNLPRVTPAPIISGFQMAFLPQLRGVGSSKPDAPAPEKQQQSQSSHGNDNLNNGTIAGSSDDSSNAKNQFDVNDPWPFPPSKEQDPFACEIDPDRIYLHGGMGPAMTPPKHVAWSFGISLPLLPNIPPRNDSKTVYRMMTAAQRRAFFESVPEHERALGFARMKDRIQIEYLNRLNTIDHHGRFDTAYPLVPRRRLLYGSFVDDPRPWEFGRDIPYDNNLTPSEMANESPRQQGQTFEPHRPFQVPQMPRMHQQKLQQTQGQRILAQRIQMNRMGLLRSLQHPLSMPRLASSNSAPDNVARPLYQGFNPPPSTFDYPLHGFTMKTPSTSPWINTMKPSTPSNQRNTNINANDNANANTSSSGSDSGSDSGLFGQKTPAATIGAGLSSNQTAAPHFDRSDMFYRPVIENDYGHRPLEMPHLGAMRSNTNNNNAGTGWSNNVVGQTMADNNHRGKTAYSMSSPESNMPAQTMHNYPYNKVHAMSPIWTSSSSSSRTYSGRSQVMPSASTDSYPYQPRKATDEHKYKSAQFAPAPPVIPQIPTSHRLLRIPNLRDSWKYTPHKKEQIRRRHHRISLAARRQVMVARAMGAAGMDSVNLNSKGKGFGAEGDMDNVELERHRDDDHCDPRILHIKKAGVMEVDGGKDWEKANETKPNQPSEKTVPPQMNESLLRAIERGDYRDGPPWQSRVPSHILDALYSDVGGAPSTDVADPSSAIVADSSPFDGAINAASSATVAEASSSPNVPDPSSSSNFDVNMDIDTEKLSDLKSTVEPWDASK